MTHIHATFETTAASRGQHRVAAPRRPRPQSPPRVPHVAKLMALAIRLDHLLDTNQVKDQAEIARAAGITRARVTQILNLANLAPCIQQEVLSLPSENGSSDSVKERDAREISRNLCWKKQWRAWQKLLKERSA